MNTRRTALVERALKAFYISNHLMDPTPQEWDALRAALHAEATASLPVRSTNQWGVHRVQVEFFKPYQPTARAFATSGGVITSLTHMLDVGVRAGLQSLRFEDIEIMLLADEFESYLFAEKEARPNELGRNFGIALACTLFGSANHEHTMYKRQVTLKFHQIDAAGNICTAVNQITGATITALTQELNDRFRKVVEF